MLNYKIVALFICCMSNDLIEYYNPLSYLRKIFPDVKERYIISLIKIFNEDQVGYIKKYMELLETETNDEIYKMLDLLEPIIKSYAYQMDHPGLTNGIVFRFDKYFGSYK
jgi:hypothetical protein